MKRILFGAIAYVSIFGAVDVFAQQPAVLSAAKPEQVQCPTPQPCKIVIISADEEQTLLGQNMIFEMAEWAMRPLGPTIQAWRRKIESSPAGAPAKKP